MPAHSPVEDLTAGVVDSRRQHESVAVQDDPNVSRRRRSRREVAISAIESLMISSSERPTSSGEGRTVANLAAMRLAAASRSTISLGLNRIPSPTSVASMMSPSRRSIPLRSVAGMVTWNFGFTDSDGRNPCTGHRSYSQNRRARARQQIAYGVGQMDEEHARTLPGSVHRPADRPGGTVRTRWRKLRDLVPTPNAMRPAHGNVVRRPKSSRPGSQGLLQHRLRVCAWGVVMRNDRPPQPKHQRQLERAREICRDALIKVVEENRGRDINVELVTLA